MVLEILAAENQFLIVNPTDRKIAELIEGRALSRRPSRDVPIAGRTLISAGRLCAAGLPERKQSLSSTSQISRWRPKWRSEAVLDIYNVSLAAFLFISTCLFANAQGNARLDIWISSAAVAVTAMAAILAYANWEEWLNVLLGTWLIMSPWVLGFAHTRAMHFSIGIGIAVTFVALVALLAVNFSADRTPANGMNLLLGEACLNHPYAPQSKAPRSICSRSP